MGQPLSKSDQQGQASLMFRKDRGLSICTRCEGLATSINQGNYGYMLLGEFAQLLQVNVKCPMCLDLGSMTKHMQALQPCPKYPEVVLKSWPFLIELGAETKYPGHYLDLHVPGAPTHISMVPRDFNPKIKSRKQDASFPLGKIIEPRHPDLVSIGIALRLCQAEHALTCNQPNRRVEHLRLIDCKRRKIVKASQNQSYICLSYVWGKDIAERYSDNSTLPACLPKTIEDAISVAVELEVPFLWIDRYCIDQNNKEEKHNLIRSMDKIYNGAEITIVAVEGDGPDLGLPGFQGPPRRNQLQLQAGSVTYVGTAYEQMKEDIKLSKWNSRGWTYQEDCLSRRILAFTTHGMYFQCQSLHHSETWSPLVAKSLSHGGQKEPLSGRIFSTGNFHNWESLLQQYCKRNLSYPEDTIDAFAGIFRKLMESSTRIVPLNRGVRTKYASFTTHFYGIPVFTMVSEPNLAQASFQHNLMWTFDPTPSDLSAKSTIFPSWSWAAVKAGLLTDNRCHLLQPFGSIHGDYNDYGISIWLQHRSAGLIRFPKQPKLEDEYKDYWPWLTISTCTVDITLPNQIGDSSLHFDADSSKDLAKQRGKIKFVCLSVQSVIDESAEHVSGLLAIEMKPATYRRIGIFQQINCTVKESCHQCTPGSRATIKCLSTCLEEPWAEETIQLA